ncbi:hypothetical protein HCA58_21885 [Micromonospora sp. HNM0581]|uniref:hypothetical protein n=1 Tax=Micromonospora sp. HNM0581 TaxID=2716341 RepID=UPI00146DD613|nr:hypothetical protein [Micromonospora sp. HNM0581]NLU80954.1 hypothetical protein [Micromonospora sp. HNM0581]
MKASTRKTRYGQTIRYLQLAPALDVLEQLFTTRPWLPEPATSSWIRTTSHATSWRATPSDPVISRLTPWEMLGAWGSLEACLGWSAAQWLRSCSLAS